VIVKHRPRGILRDRATGFGFVAIGLIIEIGLT
jgi:hypothetical protein